MTTKSASGSAWCSDSHACTLPKSGSPSRARRPTPETHMPTAAHRRAVSRPMLPAPIISTLLPWRVSVRRCRHRLRDWRAQVSANRLVKAMISPSTYSAIGRSKTPRALVTMTSLSTSSGKSRASTPAPPQWIHFNLRASGPYLPQNPSPEVPAEEDLRLPQRLTELDFILCKVPPCVFRKRGKTGHFPCARRTLHRDYPDHGVSVRSDERNPDHPGSSRTRSQPPPTLDTKARIFL